MYAPCGKSERAGAEERKRGRGSVRVCASDRVIEIEIGREEQRNSVYMYSYESVGVN